MTTGLKTTAEAEFWDFSDYARPLAIKIASRLAPTKISAYQITLFHIVLALLAIFFITTNSKMGNILAVILLQLKNIFDAVDGSLARLQNRPSQIGRFLDSNADFVTTFLFCIAIPSMPLVHGLLIFLGFTISGSFFNYYYVLYRHNTQGDTTSASLESGQPLYEYDNKNILSVLFLVYRIFYEWQDKLVDFIEVILLRAGKKKPKTLFLTILSLNGLGLQLLVLSVAIILQTPIVVYYWQLFCFLTVLITLISRGVFIE